MSRSLACGISARVALSLLFALPALHARAADLVPVADVAADYARPQQRIDVGGGRRINLHCVGSGSPTVLFDSGLSDWSSTWALIQPAVGKTTRACSYDRPGMGYSDPTPGRRTPAMAVASSGRLVPMATTVSPMVSSLIAK